MLKKLNFIFEIIIRDISVLGSLVFYIFYMFFILFFLNLEIFLNLGISLFLSFIFIFIIRLFYFKDRPKVQKYNNIFEKIDSSSFPSMHATRISILTFSSLFLGNIFYFIFMFFLSIVVCYSRIYLKKHFLSDLIAGYILGIIIIFISDIITKLFKVIFSVII